ncbi:MAG: hypothetical protein ACOX4T_11760 [Acetivibrionales bacterium]
MEQLEQAILMKMSDESIRVLVEIKQEETRPGSGQAWAGACKRSL